ncbi:hypothetical protein EYF80_050780 [Liparis tanakae]|uniref:Uncharacterized protein n=1 Tax=Liparis tanakae TaxID=230148 RepID=A0A4Z2FD16_9TELE|nr:hypothetical protein EYF80_050780 [Liparis tanakae]
MRSRDASSRERETPERRRGLSGAAAPDEKMRGAAPEPREEEKRRVFKGSLRSEWRVWGGGGISISDKGRCATRGGGGGDESRAHAMELDRSQIRGVMQDSRGDEGRGGDEDRGVEDR